MALRPPRTNVIPFTADAGLTKRFEVVCGGHGTIAANHAVKAGAEEEARWHRQADARAVAELPRTDIRKHEGGGYSISCGCGWSRRDGHTTTRYDADRVADQHEREHATVLNVAVA